MNEAREKLTGANPAEPQQKQKSPVKFFLYYFAIPLVILILLAYLANR